MDFSSNGIDLLKQLESVRYKPYKDFGGKWTVGVGHLIVPGDGCTIQDIIGTAQVDSLLKHDVQEVVECINTHVTSSINQNQFDALVIFVFNIGVGAFLASTLLRLLNEGNYEGASLQFARWNKVNGVDNLGLDHRRLAEKIFFLTP